MFRNLLLVALGGALGSCSRYLIVRLSALLWPSAPSQLGTLVVNLAGCLLIGCLLGVAERTRLIGQALSLLLVTGFCGGLTTFSTFSADLVNIAGRGRPVQAVVYAMLSIAGGVGLTLIGRSVALRL